MFRSVNFLQKGLPERELLTMMSRLFNQASEDGTIMTWQKPQFEEICLNCEINSYAPAKL
jgi:coenzyme PQQ precursor peptide PqqA